MPPLQVLKVRLALLVLVLLVPVLPHMRKVPQVKGQERSLRI
jgi:hypothetical protein